MTVRMAEVPSAPDWLVRLTGRADLRSQQATPACELDTPGNVERLVSQLKTMEPAVEGARNDTIAAAARVARDQGVSAETARPLIEEHYVSRFSPPSSPEEVERAVMSSWRAGKNPPGCRSPEGAFDLVRAPEPTTGLRIVQLNEAFEPHAMARRPFLFDGWLMRGVATVLQGAPSAGKSLFTLLTGLALATNKPLLGMDVREPGAVLFYNAEDDETEMQRRVYAYCLQHRIDYPTARRGLMFLTARPDRVTIATKVDGKTRIRQEVVDAIVSQVREYAIKLVVLDPLVEIATGVSENSNEEMAVVMAALRQIAEQGDCAVLAVHHVAKAAQQQKGGGAGDMTAGRGASAIYGSARATATLVGMSTDEAAQFGLPPERAKWFARFDGAKGNYAAPGSQTRWFEKVSVGLGNGIATSSAGFSSASPADIEDQVGVLELKDMTAMRLATAERRARATEDTTEALLTAIVQAMPADRCSLSSVVPAAAKVTGFKDRKTRQMIDGKVPLAPDFATATDQAGGVWRLRRVRAGDQKRAHVWIVREKIPMHGEGS